MTDILIVTNPCKGEGEEPHCFCADTYCCDCGGDKCDGCDGKGGWMAEGGYPPAPPSFWRDCEKCDGAGVVGNWPITFVDGERVTG